MNSTIACNYQDTRTKKRIFAELESLSSGNLYSMVANNTEKIVETANAALSSDADRDAKRSRRDSPKTVGAKTVNVRSENMPLLPIIADAELPDPKETKVEPDEYLQQLVKALYGIDVKVRNGLDLGDDYFKPITEAQQAAYTMEVLTPARENDVKTLKELVAAKGPQVVDCVNRFGESLLNLACRRGFTEVAEFLLSDEINLDVRLKDDFGRTPLHDACWHPKPQLDICGWLIKRDPSLLLVTDKRGNTPFMYARAEDFATWRQFLFDNRDSLQLLTEPLTLKQFC
jgi:Ankyrin repeats (3 copies)